MHVTSPPLVFLALAGLTSAAVIEGLVARKGGPTSTTTTTTTTSQTVCACISGSFPVSGITVGKFSTELCTCISVLSQVVTATTRAPILEGLRRYGHDKTVRGLEDKINKCGDKDKKVCTHPAHSHPSCSRRDLCGYECDAGYARCPNGQCQKSCPSPHSTHYKRDPDYWGRRAQKSCKHGWVACGVSGGGPRDWECVDVKYDLESCGGCHYGTVSARTGDATGVDCTAIPHVADVSCIGGSCTVHRCLSGYTVSESGKSCAEDAHDAGFLRNTLHPAAAYGLEHTPFDK
ncbi:hypothetical protein GGX14DRAFT_443946 [Mycena pura]|uniref:Protein CPL1-like domain-containing protein n=1 Tax=Mycena pura TaxID=153505 RepID=A0AAD6VJ66_9AGAR|nr:hypothetical protein GGX14DRAFT_443946 [Mycena pura]